MNRIVTISISRSSILGRYPCLNRAIPLALHDCRQIHTTSSHPATVIPITATAPPPAPPLPSAEYVDVRVARRRKQAELLKRGQDLRAVAGGTGGGTAKTKRFWKDVHIQEASDGSGYQIYLDARPLRTPSKEILTVPLSKPHLAHAIALEWDLLVSAQQALKHHLIPLTSLSARAMDIMREDGSGPTKTRDGIMETLLRYLETDSLLCWAPEALDAAVTPGYERHIDRVESLRTIQRRTAEPIIAYLTEKVWPGVDIVPVLDDGSIMPKPQPEGTADVIKGWIMGLGAWELAALERAVLAGKGLLAACRLIVEWSENLGHLRGGEAGAGGFGIDEAERASSLEVTYQTDMWGMVEDSHDVQKEDLRRQLGSAILLVSGHK